MTVKYCTKPKDIPTKPHFAIITGGSIHVPGDERSRQYPGHGYPASTEYHVVYAAYDNHEEWATEVARRQKSTYQNERDFVAMAITPAVIETTVSVKIDIPAAKENTQLCPRCHSRAERIARDGFSTRECKCGHVWRPADDYQPSQRRQSFNDCQSMCVS